MVDSIGGGDAMNVPCVVSWGGEDCVESAWDDWTCVGAWDAGDSDCKSVLGRDDRICLVATVDESYEMYELSELLLLSLQLLPFLEFLCFFFLFFFLFLIFLVVVASFSHIPSSLFKVQ